MLVGTESGALYLADLDARNPEESITKSIDAHHGLVTATCFHPYHKNQRLAGLLLTSSVDWSTKLWNPLAMGDDGKPLLTFRTGTYEYVSDVSWSPVHPAVFSTVSTAGDLSIWNINTSTDEPCVPTIQASRRAEDAADEAIQGGGQQHQQPPPALTKVAWARDGRSLAVGDVQGMIRVFKVAHKLSEPSPDEEIKLERTLSEVHGSI